jgi:hypothetical protein
LKIKKFAALALMFVSSSALAAGNIVMHRDPGCGCCMKWLAQAQAVFKRPVKVVNDAARPASSQRVGVPPALASCHTAIIDGYAFEGHVPPADIVRFLKAPPKGARGLAVAGMPLGSLGMEVPGRAKDRFEVIAFGSRKPVVFARH